MRSKLIQALAIGVLAALIALGLWGAGWISALENVTWLWRVRLLARPSPETARIKVIVLDQSSLDWAKRELQVGWPWPRELYGAILDFLTEAGARAIGFDVLFTEPSAYGVSDDQAFAQAIARTPAFALALHCGETAGESTSWPEEAPPPWPPFQGLDEWLQKTATSNVVASRAAFPTPDLLHSNIMWGNVSELPDPDGVYRRVRLFRVFDGRAVPALGLAVWFAAERASGTGVVARIRDSQLEINGRRIPMDSQGRAILRFRGPSGTHESFTAAAVLRSKAQKDAGETPVLDPATFRDCYVFFGFTAPGLYDLRPTPVSRIYPGVEIHVTLLDNFLSLSYLRDLPWPASAFATLLIALVAAVVIRFGKRAWQNAAAFIVFTPMPLGIGFLAYGAGWWWPVAPQTLAVLFASVGGMVVNYATEGRQKAFIKSAFRYYLGEDVIEELLRDPSKLTLGGEKKELTLFFSDIEKFSTFSEQLDPTQLIALLNEYLTEMGAIIREEGGYLDKFIGDAIVAFWNAPVTQPDHAQRAVRAALRCQRRLAERRAEWQSRFGPAIRMRIGLNTGEVTVGNMGSRDRFNYTVLGDAANLASRLEGANKAFGTLIMASESTWNGARDGFIWRELGRIRVVGRKQPVRVFEPLGLAGETSPPWLDDFHAALKSFYDGRFAEAQQQFSKIPADGVAQRYVERCRVLLAQPPETWEGVWELTEKG